MAISVPFKYSPIERVKFSDPDLEEKLAKGQPLVMTDCAITAELAKRWTVDYLASHIEPDFSCSVFHSKNNIFQYWDNAKNKGQYKFDPPTTKTEMKFREFVAKMRAGKSKKGEAEGGGAEEGEGGVAKGAGGEGAGRGQYYLQQSLVVGVGDQILHDFKMVDWTRLFAVQGAVGFGDLTSNLLLVGEHGNTTPLHYDEQENLFAQLHAQKHIFLFPPAAWPHLFPYPLHHPCDRQSMLPSCRRTWDIPPSPSSSSPPSSSPSSSPVAGQPQQGPAFPGAEAAHALHVCLNPGEMLYIPAYWWHHIIGVGEAVSLTFWFKSRPVPKVTFPLNATQLVALRRNIEGLMGELVGPTQVQALMVAIEKDDLDKTQAAAVVEVETMLRCVMAAEATRPFLKELAHRRFLLPSSP